jgi:hypothetical protein
VAVGSSAECSSGGRVPFGGGGGGAASKASGAFIFVCVWGGGVCVWGVCMCPNVQDLRHSVDFAYMPAVICSS